MKATVNTSAFKGVLSDFKKLLGGNHTLSILGCFIIEAVDGHLHLTGTDLDITLEADVPADVEERGSVVLKIGDAHSIIKKIRDDALHLESSPAMGEDEDADENASVQHLEVTTRSGLEYLLLGKDIRDFPDVISREKFETRFDLRAPDIMGFFDRAKPYMSSDDARANLCGAHWLFRDDEFLMFATDGHRLAWTERDTERMLYNPEEADAFTALLGDSRIIPRDGVLQLILMVDTDRPLSVGFLSDDKRVTHMEFSQEGFRLAARLIEGTSPDFFQVIPDPKHHVYLSRDELDELVRAAGPCVSPKTNNAQFQFGPGGLELYTSNVDVGEFRGQVRCDAATALNHPHKLGFNIRYIDQALSDMATDEVRVSFTDTLAPTIWESPADPEFHAIVMPMRL